MSHSDSRPFSFLSVMVVVTTALAGACLPERIDETPQCSTLGEPGEVEEFATGFKGTEGIAFSDDGRLFVSSGNAILEILPDGASIPFASVPSTLGLAWWNDALYVASGHDGETEGSFSFCDDERPGAVWRVAKDGTAEVFATGIRAPNFLTVTPWGTLLVSDDCASRDRIYEVTEQGETRPWVEGVPSPNGLAFGPLGDLFAVTTFVNPPHLWRVPVDGESAQPPVEFATLPDRSLPDGIAIDATGAVYVALNADGVVQRVSQDGTSEVFAEGLLTVASLAFGVGENFDRCSLYATSLLGDTVYRVRVGTPGKPLHR